LSKAGVRWSLPTLAALVLVAVAGTGAAQDQGATPVEYPTGDSCLFCHRNDIGSSWLDNSHAWTIRPAGEPPQTGALPPDATHVIGRDHYRALKQAGYGKFALLSPGGGTWQSNVFEKQCVGCHTTAVDPATGQFSSIGLDCYSCHGNVPEDHATKKGTALLSKTRKADAKEVMSICGSCHLRGGHSRATGQPFPRAYVAADDLFRDFQVDLRLDQKAELDADDTHVYVKARAALESGAKTCVECRKVHGPPEEKDSARKQFSETCHY
jgi:hypothetical protein